MTTRPPELSISVAFTYETVAGFFIIKYALDPGVTALNVIGLTNVPDIVGVPPTVVVDPLVSFTVFGAFIVKSLSMLFPENVIAPVPPPVIDKLLNVLFATLSKVFVEFPLSDNMSVEFPAVTESPVWLVHSDPEVLFNVHVPLPIDKLKLLVGAESLVIYRNVGLPVNIAGPRSAIKHPPLILYPPSLKFPKQNA
jgi:hypothetical protein